MIASTVPSLTAIQGVDGSIDHQGRCTEKVKAYLPSDHTVVQ